MLYAFLGVMKIGFDDFVTGLVVIVVGFPALYGANKGAAYLAVDIVAEFLLHVYVSF